MKNSLRGLNYRSLDPSRKTVLFDTVGKFTVDILVKMVYSNNFSLELLFLSSTGDVFENRSHVAQIYICFFTYT